MDARRLESLLAIVLTASLLGAVTPECRAEDGATVDASERRPDPPAWTRRSYRWRVSLGFAAGPAFSPASRRHIVDQASSDLRTRFGPLVEAEVGEAERNEPRRSQELDRLPEGTNLGDDGELDQVMFVTLEQRGSAFVVSGRAWNTSTRRWGARQERQTFDRAAMSSEILEVMDGLFQPVVEIAGADDAVATLRVRGGEFASVDADRPQWKSGDLLQPYYRFLDRQGRVQRVMPLPWTILAVESVDGAEARARIATGVRVALGSKRGRNVELLATAVRPTHPSTTVTLVARGDLDRPLVAHPVAVVPFDEVKKGVREEEKRADVEGEPQTAVNAKAALEPQGKEELPPLSRLLSDRHGRIRMERDPRHPLVWLRVFSGEQLLARVPFVPGAAASETLELPDDGVRLAVEGEMELLKGRLVDVVARRATLIARARTLAKSHDWKGVDELLASIDRLPGVKEFEQQLANVRVPAVEVAVKRKDRLLEARVRQLTGDAAQLVQRYLDPEKIKELREELAELRSLDLQSELKEKPEK